MSLIVGSARIDENGKISGGAVGDNNGREISTQPYYMHKKGWYVLRPKTVELADGLASAMLDACANDNIGYDQSNRYGVIRMVKKYGTLKAIAEKTELSKKDSEKALPQCLKRRTRLHLCRAVCLPLTVTAEKPLRYKP